MSYDNNYAMLKLALKFLGDLSNEVVFIGGATTCLYIDPTISDEIRPTEDVDCTIEVANIKEFYEFERKLENKGFTHDVTKGAPICRFSYKNLLSLDVMPNDKKILGFSNSWYTDGIKNKEIRKIDDQEIYTFTFPYFLASKFEAFNGRGKEDPRMSWDLEDIVLVIDGIKNFDFEMSPTLKAYFSQMVEEITSNQATLEAISGFLKHNPGKMNRIMKRLETFKSSP